MRFHNLDCSLEIGRPSYDKSWNALAFASSLGDPLPYSYFPHTSNLSAAKHDTSFMHHSTLHQQLLSSCNSPRRFAASPKSCSGGLSISAAADKQVSMAQARIMPLTFITFNPVPISDTLPFLPRLPTLLLPEPPQATAETRFCNTDVHKTTTQHATITRTEPATTTSINTVIHSLCSDSSRPEYCRFCNTRLPRAIEAAGSAKPRASGKSKRAGTAGSKGTSIELQRCLGN